MKRKGDGGKKRLSIAAVPLSPWLCVSVPLWLKSNGSESEFRKFDLLFQTAHYCIGHADLQAQIFDLGFRRLVLDVEDEDIGDAGIKLRDLRCRDLHAQ